MLETDKVFAGSIPESYDRYIVPLIFEAFAADLARRAASLSPRAVLEIAAGTGVVTRALAPKLSRDASYVVTDLNQPMLDYAASRQPPDTRIEWHRADALALPFENASFDLVCCQFGAMFFPDRTSGYREARRVLKPGGHFLFSVWDRIAANPVMAAIVEGLSRRYPQQKSWFLERTPCGYHDEAVIARDLKAAGFPVVRISVVKQFGELASAREAATGFCQGSPLRTEIEALDAVGLEAATRDVAAVIEEKCGKGPTKTPLQALVVETVK